MRCLAALFLVVLAGTGLPSVARATSPYTPPGWTQSIHDDYVQATSPPNSTGQVTMLTPIVTAFSGDLATFVTESARALVAASGGALVSLKPYNPRERRVRELPPSADAVFVGADGIRAHMRLYAQRGDLMSSRPTDATTVQLVVISAPEAIAKGTGEARLRWQQAEDQANYVFGAGWLLTQELFDRARGATAPVAPPVAPTAPVTPSSNTAPLAPPPVTPAGDPVIWSARGNETGVVFVSPCSTDGTTVVGIVRRREYVAFFNPSSMLVDETRQTVATWSGGRGQVRFGQPVQQGAILAMTADFEAAGGRVAGWFSLVRRADNFVQRGYVLAPVALANDPRVQRIRTTVQDMMLRGEYGELNVEGTPPQPAAGGDVAGVFTLSGLAFALDGRALSLRPVEIGVFKNGGATETGSGLTGVWRRITGGYSIAYGGTGGYVARVSDTCRTAAATASRPVPPAARDVAAAASSCSSTGVTVNFARSASRQECSMLGGQQYCRMVPYSVDSLTTFHPRCP